MLEYSVTPTGQNDTCPDGEAFNSLLDKVSYSHRWFTREHVEYALNALTGNAAVNNREFSFPGKANGKTIGFWMRPLSPFDGLDLILLSLNAGFRCLIRTGETDTILHKGIIDLLENRFPYLKGKTEFTDRPLRDVDARVITGEDPTTSQLKYFAKKPLFQDTVSQYRTTAVITGEETSVELEALADDLCMFFGRSKYSISTLAVPSGYDFHSLLKSLERYLENGNHSGYFNHYEYRKAAYIISGESVIDNGFLTIKKESGESHSIGVVDYTEYEDVGMLKSALKGRQLFIAKPTAGEDKLIFGSACKRNFSLVEEFLLFLNKIC